MIPGNISYFVPVYHGIDHWRLNHWAWRYIAGEVNSHLRDKDYAVDLEALEHGAINVFWNNELDLQSNIFGL